MVHACGNVNKGISYKQLTPRNERFLAWCSLFISRRATHCDYSKMKLSVLCVFLPCLHCSVSSTCRNLRPTAFCKSGTQCKTRPPAKRLKTLSGTRRTTSYSQIPKSRSSTLRWVLDFDTLLAILDEVMFESSILYCGELLIGTDNKPNRFRLRRQRCLNYT